jgi:ComF family protein
MQLVDNRAIIKITLYMLKEIKKTILDVLFPICCLHCGNGDAWACNECFRKIKILSAQVCPYCEKVNVPGGGICPRCKEKFLGKYVPAPLDRLVVAAKYKEAGISRLIHFFKYRLISDLHEILGKLIVKSLIENNLPLPDFIIPVPLHKRRLRWRGFNQAELLANYISANLAPGLEIPVATDIISRKKYTVPQMKIRNYSERKKNLQNVFVIDKDKKNIIANKKILLVDDVATTGSTLFECGRALKATGAGKVYACVIARQEWKNVL